MAYIAIFLIQMLGVGIRGLSVYVTVGHFCGSAITMVIFIVYSLLRFFPLTFKPMLIIHLFTTDMGLFISFKDFPIWFGIIYTIYFIYTNIQFFYLAEEAFR